MSKVEQSVSLQFYRPASFPRLRVALPLVSTEVCAGFPSPADDHIEGEFDLNELLISNPPATFLVRVSGESMKEADICHGDLLIVDRSVQAHDGHIVVACLDGEFTVKRLRRQGKHVWLQPANVDFPRIEVTKERDFQVWGVVMQVLRQHATAVEVYSIDEAFLSLEGMMPGQMEAYSRQVREIVRQWTGIPIGVGVGATKVLAKLANRQAKKTGGVCVLDHESQAGQDLLEEWPVGELWGVAARLSARLGKLGILTAGQLARAKRTLLRQKFGVVVERMAMELNGTSCLALEEVQPDRKNICCSRSFGRPVESLDELSEAVATHASRAGEKLRRQGLAASAVCVFLMTNRHRPELPQYHPQAGRELIVPSSFTPELVGECQRILQAIYRPGYRYVKAGVLCLELVPDDEKQASLLRPVDPEREAKERRLMEAADKLNLWYGRGTVRAAAAGGCQGWQMRRDRLSPCYTTRLADVPRAAL